MFHYRLFSTGIDREYELIVVSECVKFLIGRYCLPNGEVIIG